MNSALTVDELVALADHLDKMATWGTPAADFYTRWAMILRDKAKRAGEAVATPPDGRTVPPVLTSAPAPNS